MATCRHAETGESTEVQGIADVKRFSTSRARVPNVPVRHLKLRRITAAVCVACESTHADVMGIPENFECQQRRLQTDYGLERLCTPASQRPSRATTRRSDVLQVIRSIMAPLPELPRMLP